MAQSNRDRVGAGLELLNQGLAPFVNRTCRGAFGPEWLDHVMYGRKEYEYPRTGPDGQPEQWDVAVLLAVMWDRWSDAFRTVLGQSERTLVSELRDVRNRWAHQEPFSADDTYRALDSMQRLLTAVSAIDQSIEIDKQKQEVLRLRFEEQARKEVRRASSAPLSSPIAPGLRPWREIVMPHPDVVSGRYQQAEFAADLGQVARGQGSEEYRNPRDFFQRTYITEGLRHLLMNALWRLGANTGDPVVELQTNFGGGKTHSMLALFHLVSGASASDLPGIEPVLQAASTARPPAAQRAVLVGTELSPGQPRTKPDGTVVRTLWGELAWQLMGKDGYAAVAEADRQGVSPGSEALRELFAAASPCLILIDEWVAYMRQLYGVSGLPAGSFDANLSFAQSLTEAAKAAPRTLLVASIPASDIEIGGEGGREAVVRLRNVFARLESTWRPAGTEEGFEIVRRRLFQPITQPKDFAARDAVAKAFVDLYRTQSQEFPSNCGEGVYEQRIKAAFPIHPELFDRLYNDWSHLDRFQRTRGVLRLMAAVIHALWQRQDGNLLILPASVPIDDPAVQFELTRYLEDAWVPIIEKDVDGSNSLPLRLDSDHPNLGRYSATRRVARTIYMGSAPTLTTANRGIEEMNIKLGCVQPGESVATFGDALRRLTEQATHLYVQDKRYWYSTQPSVTRVAQDRAAQYAHDIVHEEIERRLRLEANTRGGFARVHACPTSSGDLPDERDARLVILRPSHPHAAKDTASPAMKEAATMLEQRGNSPRYNSNTLIFAAADRTRLDELEQAARQYLAWKSIDEEQEILNLDAFQRNQARTRREHADGAVKARIPETYTWLLVPEAPATLGGSQKAGWREIRLQPAQEAVAIRASRKLENDGLLITKYAGTNLRLEMDKVPLWRGDSVSIKQLADDFAQYLYLPRVKDTDVLLAAVRDGLAALTWEREAFAYADSYDATHARYLGLKAAQQVMPSLDGLLVKPEAAMAQFDAEMPKVPPAVQPGTSPARTEEPGQSPFAYGPTRRGGETNRLIVEPASAPPVPQAQRFYGSITFDSGRAMRDVTSVIEDVVQHLSGLVGATVAVTVEVHAELPPNVPDHIVRTVNENCLTLKFSSFGFEKK